MPSINSRGNEFHQLSERIPLLKWTYTAREENYDTDHGVKFTKDNFAIPLVLVTVRPSRRVPRVPNHRVEASRIREPCLAPWELAAVAASADRLTCSLRTR